MIYHAIHYTTLCCTRQQLLNFLQPGPFIAAMRVLAVHASMYAAAHKLRFQQRTIPSMYSGQ